MARETYSLEEVRQWNKRYETEADAHLKRAIGEVFYHGLNRLAAKDVRIKHLEESLDKAAGIEASLRDELAVVQSKAKEEATSFRKQQGLLQRELDDVKLESLKENEALATEVATMRSQIDLAQESKSDELTDAYNAGFFAYLKAFLGAHFDYDWSTHFPPSTSKFMEDFKAKNAAEIEEERLKIESQKKEEAEAQTGEGETSRQKGDVAAGGASPSGTQGEAP